MPIYVYACTEGHTVEETRAIAERDAVTYCERCLVVRNETRELRRVPAAPASTFPGASSWR